MLPIDKVINKIKIFHRKLTNFIAIVETYMFKKFDKLFFPNITGLKTLKF